MQENSQYPIKWITPDLATCYAPQSEMDLNEIHRKGISVIVNMCAECYDLAEIEEQAGFEVYRLFATDMEAPLLDELESAQVHSHSTLFWNDMKTNYPAAYQYLQATLIFLLLQAFPVLEHQLSLLRLIYFL